MALTVERPIRTRAELGHVPIVGPIFQVFCDASDFASFNAGMAKEYVPVLPFLVAVPSAYTLVSGARSLLSLPTMIVAYSLSLRS